MLLAVITGVALSRYSQRSLGLGLRERVGIGIGAFCGGMIGAKLPFALADWEGLFTGQAWFDNGKTILFGLVGGYLGVEVAKWSLGVQTKTGDSFAVPVAGAIAVGRIACFSAGCCAGIPTRVPWGVNFGDGVRRHPTQLYESAFHFLASFGLALLRSKQLLRGQLIKLYILSYLAYRFATEFLRPEPAVAFGLTGYQLAALGIAPLFIALWVRDDRRSPRFVKSPPADRVLVVACNERQRI
jgi:phosphatidylglycerol:prolipoprotein diacylglycerol transferase